MCFYPVRKRSQKILKLVSVSARSSFITGVGVTNTRNMRLCEMVRPIHEGKCIFNNALSHKPSFLIDVEVIKALKGCQKNS